MDRKTFEGYVEEAVDSLPKKFKKLLDNIAVIVEDTPPLEVYRETGSPRRSLILGTYQGVPYKHRGPYYGNYPPDVIVIYQKPIEKICGTEEKIRQTVREVVIHEIGHYFGFSDAQMREIESS
ncbi:MAG: metallopeptidase family protein [Acidobacteria bacterium]|nr:metallopeptidase family protein [Acidobacteriota bacterium]MBU1339379.1 metallopeptidase family protein [Acidobacteriota bacterium]MBU1475413.1 metallopeptidase family protein [Acidobacteriota bacterium]MBU4253240.1 metallopeptidase family protein [Acidobacteriota bacterium]MBU4331239.1 metallopeptidase family protein [Acidobacteriota bacterium]